MSLGSILRTIFIGNVSKAGDLESFESFVARISNDVENGVRLGKKDAVVLASFARKNVQLGMEPIETFVSRVKNQLMSDLRLASEDTKRLALELEKRLHLDEIHADVMNQLKAAETELDAMKKAWEGEEQDARTYFKNCQVADEVVESLHTILGEAGIEINNADMLKKIEASIARRIHKIPGGKASGGSSAASGVTASSAPTATPVSGSPPNGALGTLIALAAAPVPGTPVAKS